MLAIALPGTALAQATVGTITQLTGTATVERAGATSNAAISMPIQLHDKLTTGRGSQLTIGLVDNGVLTMSDSSTMVMDDSTLVHGIGAPTKVGLIGGTLRSLILGDLRSAGGGFEIHTPNAIGAVRGTDVTTTYTDGTPRSGYKDCTQFTDFDVQEGELYVTNALNPSAGGEDVKTGHRITVACGYYPGGTSAAGAGGFLGLSTGTWLAGGAGLLAATGTGLGVAAGTGGIGGGGSSTSEKQKKKSEKK